MQKHNDTVAPWRRRRIVRSARRAKALLDYFGMLHAHELQGYIDLSPEKGEAYITRAALCVLSSGSTAEDVAREAPAVARRLRDYTAWRSRAGKDCLRRPFAMHMVDDATHRPLLTIVLPPRRQWWQLFLNNRAKIITYDY